MKASWWCSTKIFGFRSVLWNCLGLLIIGLSVTDFSSGADVFWVNFDNPAFTINETNSGNLFGYYNDSTTSSVVNFQTISSFGLNGMDGGDRVVMSFPAFAQNQGLFFNPNVPANGGGVYLNQYSMMWDIYVTSRDNWLSFYQTNATNNNSGELYIRPDDGGIGITGVYNGEVQLNRWTRVGITVDLTLSSAGMRKFIDGNLVGTIDLSSVDGRWSTYRTETGGMNYLLTEDAGFTLGGYISAFYFTDRTLSDAEMAAWGGAKAAGFALPAQPEITRASVYYAGSTFAGMGLDQAIDSSKSLAKETSVPTTLDYSNLTNVSSGLNGIVFDISNLSATTLTNDDFEFKMSPTGAFDQLTNPPGAWQAAPMPSSINVLTGAPSRAVLVWPNNSILNRWLRVTVKATANTGLQAPEVYYIGHLLGETTGTTIGPYTVSFADITPIRSAVGQSVDASSIADIDKNGIVAFADISSMRPNVGAQLTNITVP